MHMRVYKCMYECIYIYIYEFSPALKQLSSYNISDNSSAITKTTVVVYHEMNSSVDILITLLYCLNCFAATATITADQLPSGQARVVFTVLVVATCRLLMTGADVGVGVIAIVETHTIFLLLLSLLSLLLLWMLFYCCCICFFIVVIAAFIAVVLVYIYFWLLLLLLF